MSDELKTDRAELVGRLNSLAPDIFDMPKTCKAMHDAADMIEADGARLAAAGEQKPVAYRWRVVGDISWTMTKTKPVVKAGSPARFEVEIEPLYAAPQPAPGWDEAIDAMETEIDGGLDVHRWIKAWESDGRKIDEAVAIGFYHQALQDAREAIETLRRSSQSTSDAGGGVREDWQTVPKRPTPKMLFAAEKTDKEMRDQGFANAEPEAIYYAMLDAAPALSNPAAADSDASAEARLREALENIASIKYSESIPDGSEIEIARDIARKALSPGHASDCGKQGETP